MKQKSDCRQHPVITIRKDANKRHNLSFTVFVRVSSSLQIALLTFHKVLTVTGQALVDSYPVVMTCRRQAYPMSFHRQSAPGCVCAGRSVSM